MDPPGGQGRDPSANGGFDIGAEPRRPGRPDQVPGLFPLGFLDVPWTLRERDDPGGVSPRALSIRLIRSDSRRRS